LGLYDNGFTVSKGRLPETNRERISMAAFENFLGQIKEAGIHIQNEGALTKKARSVSDWPSVVAEVALSGRREGILFERATFDEPTNECLAEILSDYSFTEVEARAVIDNTLLAGQRT